MYCAKLQWYLDNIGTRCFISTSSGNFYSQFFWPILKPVLLHKGVKHGPTARACTIKRFLAAQFTTFCSKLAPFTVSRFRTTLNLSELSELP
jgi:hypothetical protein